MTVRSLLTICAVIFATLLPVNSASAQTCTETPAMTEGPYYLSNMKMRKDITEGLAGIKTNLTLTILDENCDAIPNAQVDIWHTNATGSYSGVEGDSGTFMRGSQMTDTAGRAKFVTVFPGWYPARTMHIHVKVWVDGSERLTTQFFTSDKVTKQVYLLAPYKFRGQQRINNARDGIYQSLGASAKLLTLKAKVNPKKITLTGNLVVAE